MSSFLRMALGVPVPPRGAAAAWNNFVLNCTADAIEYLFQAPEAATITHLGFRYGTRTGTPPTYRISLQGVNSSGRADGNVLASGTFTPPATTAWNGTWQWVALGATYGVVRGQFLAIVIDYSSGTVDASNCSSFTYGSQWNYYGFPCVWTVDAGVGTQNTLWCPYGMKSAGASYGCPVQSAYSTLINLNSTPDEQALRFLLDPLWFSQFQVVGINGVFTGNAAGTSVVMSLYSGASALQSVTLDLDVGAVSASPYIRQWYFDETTLSTLAAGTEYRIGFAPQEAGASFGMSGLVTISAQDAAAMPGGGAFYFSSRTDAGAWADDTAHRPLVELIVDAVVAPSGGAVGPWGTIR